MDLNKILKVVSSELTHISKVIEQLQLLEVDPKYADIGEYIDFPELDFSTDEKFKKLTEAKRVLSEIIEDGCAYINFKLYPRDLMLLKQGVSEDRLAKKLVTKIFAPVMEHIIEQHISIITTCDYTKGASNMNCKVELK